jgi:four helix bundle protein
MEILETLNHKEAEMGASFKDLVVWQRSVELSLAIYKLTASFPEDERFGLTNQLRHASVSIASNIAEGYGRTSKGEYIQFLGHARGSNCELQTQLVIATGLDFGSAKSRQTAQDLSDEVARMLVVIMRKLRQTQSPSDGSYLAHLLFPTPYFLFPASIISACSS